ncbi:hypothetical protein FBU30_006292 [Linnemannia zychae]|nr:hypothetical protein FBU30_006292 [Linnemannia zychae]
MLPRTFILVVISTLAITSSVNGVAVSTPENQLAKRDFASAGLAQAEALANTIKRNINDESSHALKERCHHDLDDDDDDDDDHHRDRDNRHGQGHQNGNSDRPGGQNNGQPDSGNDHHINNGNGNHDRQGTTAGPVSVTGTWTGTFTATIPQAATVTATGITSAGQHSPTATPSSAIAANSHNGAGFALALLVIAIYFM